MWRLEYARYVFSWTNLSMVPKGTRFETVVASSWTVLVGNESEVREVGFA